MHCRQQQLEASLGHGRSFEILNFIKSMTITFFYPLKFFVDRGLIYGAIKTRVEFLMGSEVLTYAFLNCREWNW